MIQASMSVLCAHLCLFSVHYVQEVYFLRLALLGITFFFFFLSPDFHELWRSVMSICLLTEVKQQWAMLVLGWVTADF